MNNSCFYGDNTDRRLLSTGKRDYVDWFLRITGNDHARATNHHTFTTICPRFYHRKIALMAAQSPNKPANKPI
jgi:hypothetical protein